MHSKQFEFVPGKSKLSDFDPSYTSKYKDKQDAQDKLSKSIESLREIQEILYAQDKYSVLIVLQAMDAAGKDGTVKHVMSGVNPQGCRVTSFKAPSEEELDHDYLWRCAKQLPERGMIGIFNRSYYEEVVVTRVHPEFIKYQRLPNAPLNPEKDENFWKQRFTDINNFEKYLVNNGTLIIKLFLNISKGEQKDRLISRVTDPTKFWKANIKDVEERSHWKDFMFAYEETFKNTSTEYAPWYIIPADKKWFSRTAVSDIIVEKIKNLNLHYPEITTAKKNEITKMHQMLKSE